MDATELWDVIVVGGGPAGLSAAVTLARSRRSVLVLDAGEPRNAVAAHAHGYLGREGVAPQELLADGRAELGSYGGSVVAERVVAAHPVEADELRFAVTSTDASVGGAGSTTRYARRLLVATGLRDVLPSVAGVRERWGRDVLHCPYCHGWEVRDQAIGVLATGPAAAHQAQLFRQLSDDVVVFAHTAPEFEPEVAAGLAARGIEVIPGAVERLEIDGDSLAGVRLADGRVVPRQAVVVAPRMEVRLDGLDGLDLAVAENPMGVALVTTPDGRTSVPGVWAAGNAADVSAQVIISAGAGLRAGAMVNFDLVEAETRSRQAALSRAGSSAR